MNRIKLAALGFVVVGTVLLAAPAAHAWHFGRFHPGPRVFIGVGPVGPPWWYYPPPYYVYSPPPVVYAPPPPVVVQEPPVYVQQYAPAPPPPPPPPAPPAPSAPSAPSAQAYWYYCASAKDYYPTVQTCPEAWIPVPPRAP